MPVDAKHDNDHADQCEGIDQDSKKPGDNEGLDGIDVDGDTADKVAGGLLIVIGKRETLDMGVNRPPQIVGDPLADVGGEVLFGVGAQRVSNGDEEDGDAGEDEDVSAAQNLQSRR